MNTSRLPNRRDDAFKAEFDRAAAAVIRAKNLLHARVERFKPFKDALYDDQPETALYVVQK